MFDKVPVHSSDAGSEVLMVNSGRLSGVRVLLHCGGAMLLGAVLYSLTRDPAPALLRAIVPLEWTDGAAFRVPAQWPSLLHSYALIVATRYFFPLTTLSHRCVVALSLTLLLALELMQHPSIASQLPSSSLPLLSQSLESIRQYALFGTFDVYDLVAVMLGALAALWTTRSA